MTEAERLAERLEEKAHNHTQDDIAEWSYMTEAAALLRAQSARIAALEDALREVFIGCNHLALLIGADHPPYEAEPPVALAHYGAGDQYEIWCCWRAIMLARLALGKGSE